ncbi:LPFR motif small protein [Streptomyces sp. SL13]|uniref:LPFR motif small protein n=1 Tax=Streptantibioticus silvisoli TaxID=2705255 RepID=A0AA90KFQ4_9ACTN|nr:LPFR motif small protein [Streptantibioticus silvisoli]MDI5962561.1 LPFR motif small protein [Streptantibioticus silvisoli]MDI5969194.1 LPFR motif small protein [Streptantibioticus silvisoli]
MFRTIAEVLSSVGNAVGTVVSAPFRLVARLFGGGR